MFDIGFLELMLIGIVALVVIGPERLPDVARTAGSWINKAQRFVRGVKTDLASELKSGELKDLLGDQRKQIAELRQMVQSTKRDFEQSTAEAVKDARATFDGLEESAADAGIVKPRHATNRTLPASDADAPAATDEADSAVRAVDLVKPTNSATVESATPGSSDTVSVNKPADKPTGNPPGGAPPPASPAVSDPVSQGPRPGSWASGIVSPGKDASPSEGNDKPAADTGH